TSPTRSLFGSFAFSRSNAETAWVKRSIEADVDTGSAAPILQRVLTRYRISSTWNRCRMLRITKLTDYAVLVLADMVRAAGAARAARDIAETTRIPQPTVSKVLKLLARGALVVSERGKNGGYRLAREPESISVAEIVDVVEGPIAVTE